MKISLSSSPDGLESRVTVEDGNGITLSFVRDNMSSRPPIQVEQGDASFRMTVEQLLCLLRLLGTIAKL